MSEKPTLHFIMARNNKITTKGWGKKFEETYGRPPSGLEMEQFKANYIGRLPTELSGEAEEEKDEN